MGLCHDSWPVVLLDFYKLEMETFFLNSGTFSQAFGTGLNAAVTHASSIETYMYLHAI